MIKTLLIANRGEIACRIIRTCQEMGIRTVAVYSDADADALHVALADEAIHLGGSPAKESYLNIDALLDAAQRTEADTVHPGYGFLAENASFAHAVNEAGLTWVGPQADVIEKMGDKRAAKRLLSDVPYVPGYTDDDQSDQVLLQAAGEIGYPIMVKAAAGGGGKGMRRVNHPDDLLDALAAARREALQAFSDDTLMLEKLLIQPRHIEVQIIGDQYGQVIALGERECSIQRRHQKIIEESPAYGLSDDLRHALHQTAVNIGEQLLYQNAGTVEFLLDSDGQFYFMEMNTRLQVEHPVTEAVYAIDLVRWQLEIAQGASLQDLLPPFADLDDFAYEPDGHAIEVRVYAEDPYNQFLPTTGKVLRWQVPQGVRVDAGIRDGDTITPYYDPMVAKIIAHGHDRRTAIRKLAYALSQAVLSGLTHNISFLRAVLMHNDHLQGTLSTEFIDNHPELLESNTDLPAPVLIALALSRSHNNMSYWRNNPYRPIERRYQYREAVLSVQLTANKDKTYQAQVGDTVYQVRVIANENTFWTLEIDGHRQKVHTVSGINDQWWIQFAGKSYRLDWQSPLPNPATRQVRSQGSLRAPMPGKIISVLVSVGQEVSAGATLMIMEAMKMEHRIQAPYAGTVTHIVYNLDDSVQQDDELLTITAHGDSDA
ncbi:MAG: biotin carboxylase N-terminal domain-containing protein [Anaerolineae bacterium]